MDLRFGNRLVEHRWDAGGVTARFEDGSEDRGDLLIGADGIHSRVRRTMSPDAPAPSYTGLLNVGGVARCSGLSSTPGTMHMIWGRRAFFGYTVLEGGESWWFANVGHAGEPARDELAARTTADWKAELCALFAGDPPHVARLVERTDEIGVTPIHDMPSLPRWRRGRTVLLGDAAHAVSPSAGQGASMAIEDAIVLAKCLRDIREPEAALARYEALRRPRTERIVAVGRRRGAYKAPRSRVALRIRDLLMPIVFRHIATEKRMSWIYDYRVRWDEPVIADAA